MDITNQTKKGNMKRCLLFFLLMSVIFSKAQKIDASFNQIDTKLQHASLRLKQKVIESRNFIPINGFNENYVFLIDMSIPSGKNRFFVYSLKGDSIEVSSLVSHGSGSYVGSDTLVFSNKINSCATSLGKYKIGESYIGKYGTSFKLYGVDSSNSNAFVRNIVLHSHKAVSNTERYPYGSGFQSAGCPTVSPKFLKFLTNYINSYDKPILMWIY